MLSYQVANMQGIGMRERQEDAFAFVNAIDVTEIRTKGLLAMVADGMGGMQDGKAASEKVSAIIRKDFELYDRERDMTSQLLDSVYHAGNEVYQIIHGDGGSTIVACVFFQEQLHFCSVGDSFLFLYRDGVLLRVNHEHNRQSDFYLDAIREGSMDPTTGRTHPEKDALTQFVGMDGLEEIDCFQKPLRLKNNDIFLLCSDGVGGVLTDEEIAGCLQGSPAKMCADLEELVISKKRPHQDNYTALIIRCGY